MEVRQIHNSGFAMNRYKNQTLDVIAQWIGVEICVRLESSDIRRIEITLYSICAAETDGVYPISRKNLIKLVGHVGIGGNEKFERLVEVPPIGACFVLFKSIPDLVEQTENTQGRNRQNRANPGQSEKNLVSAVQHWIAKSDQ